MSDIVLQVKQFYNEAGEYFSKTRRKTYGKPGDSTWPELGPYVSDLKDGDEVLDLGCGNGRLLTGIAAKVEYLGIDFSESLIREARRLHPKWKFVLADVLDRHTWKGLGSYEAIFLVAVMHHIPRRAQQVEVLRRVKDHLKDDGFVYMSVWNMWQRRFLRNHVESMGLKLRNWRWLSVPFQRKWRRFCYTFDKRYMRGVVGEAGLEVESLRYVDNKGSESSWVEGRNLVCVARRK